jgi:hypothetical protein
MRKLSKLLSSIVFFASILFNFYCFIEYSNLPTYDFVVLNKEIEVGNFRGNKEPVFLTIPKGAVGIDLHPRGIASIGIIPQNYRRVGLSILLNEELIDYSQSSNIDSSKATYEMRD